ncbi:hypothetical protein [Pedobacter helvus]|uniref:O-antigen polymerase n=1 Tax=Pedobacter helvus TaxID=2563444 RepID=A0ABW9JH58_9SPHI
MFFITTLLFPVFVLNKVFFVAIFAVMLYDLKANNKMITIAPIVVFIVFALGYLMSLFSSVAIDRAMSNQLMLSVLVLFLIYPIIKYKIDIDKVVKISGIVLIIFTGIFFLLIVTFLGNPVSSLAYDIFEKYGNGSSGLRSFSEEASLTFHFGTVPFLYLSTCLFFYSYLKNRKRLNLVAILISLPALIVSTSRGLWIICIIGMFLIFFLNLRLGAKILLVCIAIPTFLSLVSYVLVNTNIFSSEEESNDVKIGHVTSFIDNINPVNLILGDGLGAYYYSKGSGAMKSHTEVTPLDMFRYFGLILTGILYLSIIFPAKNISSYLGEKRFFVAIFALYLINSFTNPIMFNSYGLLIVLWYWSKILTFDSVENEKLVGIREKDDR